MTWVVKTKSHWVARYEGCGHIKDKCACLRKVDSPGRHRALSTQVYYVPGKCPECGMKGR